MCQLGADTQRLGRWPSGPGKHIHGRGKQGRGGALTSPTTRPSFPLADLVLLELMRLTQLRQLTLVSGSAVHRWAASIQGLVLGSDFRRVKITTILSKREYAKNFFVYTNMCLSKYSIDNKTVIYLVSHFKGLWFAFFCSYVVFFFWK